jgi:hypothetical protein
MISSDEKAPSTIIVTWQCKGCDGSYSAELTAENPASWTAEDWAAFMDAGSEHAASHYRTEGTVSHIRWRMAPEKRGDGFYAPKYSSSENGSRTLCGASATDSDTSWGDARHARNLTYVSCDRCKELRAAGKER